jgi:hypothetical protein
MLYAILPAIYVPTLTVTILPNVLVLLGIWSLGIWALVLLGKDMLFHAVDLNNILTLKILGVNKVDILLKSKI